ncbi:hypothetical protein M8C21_019973 [Ambrosia artemisiifolia]|uniref:Uncharacterized protein n=1 Tax=Ambrosia artemisiifolia TaxID=4212 RepID=A0AAD5BUS2_AMBAR|nr:hypothetical protein M8C21_019973 [Ambrosia artemisiifolia]
MTFKTNQPKLTWKQIPDLKPLKQLEHTHSLLWSQRGSVGGSGFACVSLPEKKKRVQTSIEFTPTAAQLLNHPLAIVALVPKDVALFAAGAVAGAAAKTVTAPLDRIKLIMQTHGLRAGQESAKKTIGFLEAVISVGKESGVKGYWKGNLAQVIRILPYSAVQLFAYESYKKLFRGEDGELSVIGRLAAGASAGMTSTFVTYPLDVLRLRMAVDPGHQTMTNVVVSMLKEEGLGSFYRGLIPSLISIAPYVAVNFCVFDLVKKSLPEKYRNKTEASLVTAFVAATVATTTCYPLDTIRRQMQMRGTPYKTVLDAFSGIIAQDGVAGLYRGFVPNALKTLPNSSIRLTTFDAIKRLIATSEKEFQRILEENKNEHKLG